MLWQLFADGVLSAIPLVHKLPAQLNQSMAAVDSGRYLWTFLAARVLGPVVEELIFRGLIFNCLRQLFKTPVRPVLISAALFGIWHENAVHAVFALILPMIGVYIHLFAAKKPRFLPRPGKGRRHSPEG
ncbi:CPBP family intramembrane glutamic endopeptidase [Pseudoramibacter faecis]|uniref:CPBP family intramembrane glutamic endopeptidase n=1 Tax=Pseudoramibacter faecis TaxID=3108534 RepID=UPI002E769542|nr:CPBP family intramembrane glutamic endopeptidase [Pseudoramibacter sp. HA2172]